MQGVARAPEQSGEAREDEVETERKESLTLPRRGCVAFAGLSLLALVGCGGAGGDGPTVSPASPSPGAFTVDVAWTRNTDNPDGYLVYVGPTASSASTLVKTLNKGASNWNAASPAVQLSAADVAAALGAATQVCVVIRAYNAGGVSLPSQATCAALP
jgi:hypothetical protein